MYFKTLGEGVASRVLPQHRVATATESDMRVPPSAARARLPQDIDGVTTMNMLPLLGYIDPGTGSFLLQLLIGGLLGGIATIKLWWGRVRGFFRSEARQSASAE